MDSQKENPILKLNIHFAVVFIITCIVFLNDIIIYLFNLEYTNSLCLSTGIFGIVFIYLIKKKKINFTKDFNFSDMAIFIYMIYMMRDMFNCEFSWDVINYHIYLQENPFGDKVDFDFFPGRIYCCFLFPLGDRFFYLFRYFLGYRLGIIASYYLIIVLFYQMKKTILLFTNNSKKANILAYIIFGMQTTISSFGLYYIDNLALVFLIEIFYCIFKYKDFKDNKWILYFVGLCCGIAIGIKITSVLFIAIFVLIYIINNFKYKNIRIINLFIFILAVIIPFMVYLIDNYKQTGSIIFPYYNAIFKSKYFESCNWKDPYFFLDGFALKIIWPLIMGFFKFAYGDQEVIRDISFGIGYSFVIIYIGYVLWFKKKKEKVFYLSILSLILTIIWLQFLQGYMRYARIVSFFYCVIIAVFCIECIEKIKNSKFYNKLNIVSKFPIIRYKTLLRNTTYCVLLGILFCITIISWGKQCDFENMKYVLKDRKSEEYIVEIPGVWGSITKNLGYEVLVRNSNTPIYNLELYEYTDLSLEMYYDRIKNNDIYVILDSKNLDFYLETLKKNNFEIQKIVDTFYSSDIPYIDANSCWFLCKLEYIEY